MYNIPPPYDQLRIYNDTLQWSFEDVAKELFRVIKQNGVIVWIVNDSIINGSKSLSSFTQCLFFKSLGFNIHDVMIWQKPNFANPSGNRYHQVFEYMFIITKGKLKTFNPIKDRKNVYAGKSSYGKNSVRLTNGRLKERVKGKDNSEYGMRHNIWLQNTTGQSGETKKYKHPAMFPLKLIEDHIKTWSDEVHIVLDPFAGSGTTAIAALNSNRKFICIEKDTEYFEIMRKRVLERQMELAEI